MELDNLLGATHEEQTATLSMERLVDGNVLSDALHSSDDKVAPPVNSTLYYDAL